MSKEADNLKVDMNAEELENISNGYYETTKDDMVKKCLQAS